MHLQRLTPTPCVLHGASVANIIDLFDYIKLAQAIDSSSLIFTVREPRYIPVVEIFDVQQPIIDQATRTFTDCCLNSTTTVMTANDNVLNLKYIHRILNNGKTV